MNSRNLLKNAGIVGLGGATFPSHVKLSPPKEKPIDTFILNGAECEPYLNADNRLMIEQGKMVVFGFKVLMKAMGIRKGFIAVEKNKPDAIYELKEICEKEPEIEVVGSSG